MNNSIVDYLKSTGQPSDFSSRTKLAASKGIVGYTGSAEQNIQLLNLVRGAQIAQTPTVQTPQTTSNQTTQTQQTATPAPAGGGSLVDALIAKGYNPVDAQNAANGPRVAELTREYLGGGSTGLGSSGFNMPTINLPELYDSLYKSSGILDVESELSSKSRSYAEAVAKIKDNPYLSEATMTGRLKKLDDKFNADTQNLRNDIATRKADIETRLNIQTKQFDINSQQATQALSQFQTLLSSGALDNLSGEDIANITRSTGLSSSMINSAIAANKKKNTQTTIQSFDDGTNQGFVVIDTNTGDIIKKENVAESKPTKGGGGSGSDDEPTPAEIKASAKKAALSGKTYQDMLAFFRNYLNPSEIYKIYTDANYYGRPPDDVDEGTGLYKTQ